MELTSLGNHDITLDSQFYSKYGLNFHNQYPQDQAECRKLLEQSDSITYLRHDSTTIKLQGPNGPHTHFKIFGSPYSPAKGMWAFGYESHRAKEIWDEIPVDTDIVVTHTPPKYHCDERSDRRAAGCEALRCRLWTVRPRLAICGHVHESRGAEVIKWNLMEPTKYKEKSVRIWSDLGSGNKKLSLIDLTSKGGTRLDNDGFPGDYGLETDELEVKEKRRRSTDFSFSRADLFAPPELPKRSKSARRAAFKRGLSKSAYSFVAAPNPPLPLESNTGQGGDPPSGRCDLEGMMGRNETCVINAAIIASSWPHKASGGKLFNKPIVVDIDLPVWEAETTSEKPVRLG